FGFRMIEAMGVIDRRDVAAEVKGLDQDARGQLRKHGVRFGQFTIFMPLLLKPAPTRLRLVLRSLADGVDEFPESPPPGLVTIPFITEIPAATYLMSGYKPAGARAIRIDMLERLADLLRAEDSRGGFEANPDMLSITGMTLEQFADLMQGLGYKAEKGERDKPVRETPVEAAPEGEAAERPPITEEESAMPAATEEAPEEDTKEVFYTFTWGGNRGAQQNQQRRGKPQGKKGGKPKGKGKPGGGGNKPRNFESRPPKKDKIDPDNPFAAALMGLKTKDGS
ncbi:MAG: disulfide oxidoreductase, partial [Pseudomonadota bacterium]